MIYSMTGFSRSKIEEPWGVLTLELSSVNSRYLELSTRTSRDLNSFDTLIQSTIKSKLGRGKIQARMELSWAPSLNVGKINGEILTKYYNEITQLELTLTGQNNLIKLTELLSLPGVMENSNDDDQLQEQLTAAITNLLNTGLESLIKMRATEGEALLQDISSNLEKYESLLNQISSDWSIASSSAFEDYKARIAKVLERFSIEVDGARIAQELVIQADKWDIAEELSRSTSHLQQFRTILSEGGSVGRKLDFLLQEMNREINTIGSKVASTEIRWLVVEAKTLLERIREQIQNIE